jgi:hypothetical protein
VKLNLEETKLVGLTMKLDLKANEYTMLCNKLEEYEQENIDENDEKFHELLIEFQKNHDEIEEIKKQLIELESTKNLNKESSSNYNDMFKKTSNNNLNTSNTNDSDISVRYKESFWQKIKRKIKAIFK